LAAFKSMSTSLGSRGAPTDPDKVMAGARWLHGNRLLGHWDESNAANRSLGGALGGQIIYECIE
jgi:hypothetical protein